VHAKLLQSLDTRVLCGEPSECYFAGADLNAVSGGPCTVFLRARFFTRILACFLLCMFFRAFFLAFHLPSQLVPNFIARS
jgi:hypothetical protein